MNERNLFTLLEANDIPPDVIQNFVSNGITAELFHKLMPEHLKELCPHLGTRLKLSEIITAYAPTESCSYVCTDSLSEIENSIVKPTSTSFSKFQEANVQITRFFPDFDLHTLLQTTAGGNSILKFYESNKILNNTKRNQLTDIIIKHIYTYIVNHKITYEEYNILAAKILTIFPTESIGIYYTRPISKGQSLTGRPVAARGKLVDKVRNLIFKYGERKRKSSASDNEVLAKRTQASSSYDEQDSSNLDILWLKTNNEPFDEVVNKWKASFEYRKDHAKYPNVHDFFVDWPILNDPRSHSLINIDFELKYPDSGVKFFLNFNEFFNKIFSLKKNQNEALLNIVQALNNLDEDRKIPGQIHVMTHLIPPKGRLNKNVKFSSQEAVDSIFLLVKNAGDIASEIEKQKQKAIASKSPVQPYIILQGTLLNCSSPLLIIDNIKYSFNTIAQAFDTLFKAFHVFDASYPRASNHIHLIIQRCVYKIQTKYDNVVPYIADILHL